MCTGRSVAVGLAIRGSSKIWHHSVLERGLPGHGDGRRDREVVLVQAAHGHRPVAAPAVEAAQDQAAQCDPPEVRAALRLLGDGAHEVGVLEESQGG